MKPSSLQLRSIRARKVLVVLKYKNFTGLNDEMPTHSTEGRKIQVQLYYKWYYEPG